MEKDVFSRKELYDLVWSTPVLTLSKKYKVSESSLRTLCRRQNIPLPPAGHWRKVERNKKFVVKPLPTDTKGAKDITLKLRDPGDLVKKVKLDQYADHKDRLHLTVPSKLTNPDPLIVAAKDSLTSGKGRYYQYGGLVWTAGGQLDIRVSPKNVARALRFIDTLLKLLRVRGHDVGFIYGSSCTIIYNQHLEIQLKELMRSVYVERKSEYSNSSWTGREYQPTGKLALCIGKHSVKVWKDGKLPLEEQLWSILVKLEAEAEKLNSEEGRRQKRLQEEQERLRVERKLREQKEKELAAFKDLLDQAQRWQQSNILREYINAVQFKAETEGMLTDELINWIRWAQQKADYLDPVVNE